MYGHSHSCIARILSGFGRRPTAVKVWPWKSMVVWPNSTSLYVVCGCDLRFVGGSVSSWRCGLASQFLRSLFHFGYLILERCQKGFRHFCIGKDLGCLDL